jgi:TonB family protein
MALAPLGAQDVAPRPTPATDAVKSPLDDTARGIGLYRQGKHKDAIKLLRAAAKKQKEDADVWLYLGLSYLHTNETKKAREALQTARRLRPQDGTTLNGLAVTLVRSGDDFGAMEVATEAVKHAQQNHEAHYLLAVINYRLGRLPKALEGADAAIKLNPTFASAHYLKGQTLLSLSDQAQTNARNETPAVRSMLSETSDARFREAMQTLETFMRLAPNAPEVPKLREELQQIRLFRDALDPSNPNRTIFAAREVTSRAVIQSKPEPLYTEKARRNQTTGTVRLRIVLGADGNVQHIYPTRRLPDGLTEASIAAARRIKFIPAMKDGRPVSQFVTIEYNFNIY